LNAPGAPGYAGELGKWCGYQAALATTCGMGGCPAPPPPPSCADCATYSSDPGYQQSFQLVSQSYASMTCADLQNANVPGPLNAPGAPGYAGELGKWCGYQAALATACGSGGCPAPPTSSCDDCLTLSSDPDFATAYTSGTATYTGMDCTTLAAQNVPSPPFSVGVAVQTGRWCAIQEAGSVAGCGASSPVGQCPGLNVCATTPSVCAPPVGCADCIANSSDPGYQQSFQMALQAYSAMTCPDLQSAAPSVPQSAPGTAGYMAELGKWCGYQGTFASTCGGGGC
ncbi:MAG: hypothetical protein IV100_32060, partial [Myxococcales bacterium]|nr:hypothetical protein [Myxococcales bacterium]